MSVSDPIADLLTRIRNAGLVGHGSVVMPTSRTKQAIAKILADEGFINKFEVVRLDSVRKMLKLFLRYRERNKPIITKLERVSKPGLRVYVKKHDIPRYYGGLGVAVLSTCRGVMTGQNARQQGLGGELLFYVV